MRGRGVLPAVPSRRVSRGNRSAHEPPSLGAAWLGEAGSLAPPQAARMAVRRRAKQTRAATTGGLSHAREVEGWDGDWAGWGVGHRALDRYHFAGGLCFELGGDRCGDVVGDELQQALVGLLGR